MKRIIFLLIVTLINCMFFGCMQSESKESLIDHESEISEIASVTDDSSESEEVSENVDLEISEDINQANLDVWLGEYEYAHNSGKAGIVYELWIFREQDMYHADVFVRGWLLDVSARANVQGSEHEIKIIFDTYLNPEGEFIVLEPPFLSEYHWFQEGDVLLWLRSGGTEDAPHIITSWGKMPLPDVTAFEKKIPE